MTRALAVGAALGLAAVAPLAAAATAPRGSLDVTEYGVVLRAPGMSEVETLALTYGGEGGAEHAARLYLPPSPRGGPLPVVVFANGVGGRILDWTIYDDWARLVASHGMAAVTAESASDATVDLLEELLGRLRREDLDGLVDPDRTAVWACSANVFAALRLLERRPPGVQAAVLYYGSGGGTADLAPDLPVLFVLAGRDAPELNAAIRGLWGHAVEQGWPWTMVQAPGLMHAFDALDESSESRRVVRQTVSFLGEHLLPAPAGPEPDLARLALQHAYAREWGEGADVLAEMHRLWPDDGDVVDRLAQALQRAGRSAEAERVVRKAIEEGGETSFRLAVLGEALLSLERPAEAVPVFARARELGAGPPTANQHAHALLRAGRHAEAAAEFAALARLPGWGAIAHYQRARALVAAGDAEGALDALEAAVVAGHTSLEQMRQDPDLAGLRDHPRFQALVADGR